MDRRSNVRYTHTAPQPGNYGSLHGVPTSIVVSPGSSRLFAVGASTQLTAVVRDLFTALVVGASVVWSSSNPSVARVDAAGNVTAVADGSATITARAGPSSATASVTVISTPAALFGNLSGAGQVLDLYVDGSSPVATVAAVGQASLTTVVDGTLPSGRRATKWESAVNPNTGTHWRPSADYATTGGTGANASATTVRGAGLEVPASVGYGGGANFHQDTQAPVSPTAGTATLFDDHTAGVQWIVLGKVMNNTRTIRIGDDASADLVELQGDDFNNVPWLKAEPSLANIVSGITPLPRLLTAVHHTTTPSDGVFVNDRYGRDIFAFKGGPGKINGPSPALSSRRVRLFGDSGFTCAPNCEANIALPVKGRLDRTQWQLLADAAKAWYPDMWEDPRANISETWGDSFQDGIDFLKIANGENGAPAIASTCAMNCAQSGNNPQRYESEFVKTVRDDADFSQRTGKKSLTGGEYLNGGTEAENFAVIDAWTAQGPLFTAVPWNLTYNQAANQATGLAYAADLAVVYSQHALGLLDLLQSAPFAAFNFANGTTDPYPTGQNPIFLSSNHPTSLTQGYWRAFYREMIRLGVGGDVTPNTMWGSLAVDTVTLTAGSPTANPAITARNFFGTALAGKTWTHAMVFADLSSAAAVATVDADGTIHRVANGHCARLSTASDGGQAALDVFCGATGFSDTFTRADNALTLGAPWSVWNGATAGITSNQAYFPSNTDKAIATVDAGTPVHTATITLATSSGQDAGLVVSLSDGSNYVRVFWEAGDWFLQKVIAGVTTTLGAVAGSQNAGDVLTLSRNGTAISSTLNGVALLSATDAFNDTATNVGFTAAASTPRFDNFSWA